MSTNSAETPRPRKCIVVLTDSEWRDVKVIAAMGDTTVQGWLTSVALRAIQEWRASSP